MGATRTDIHKGTDLELSALAKALGHPARIAILRHLLRTRACITGELTLEIGLAPATVAQHLRELKSAGLIQGKVAGHGVNYCINPNVWRQTAALFADLFAQYPENQPRKYPCHE
ncbi:MAG TPA: metalloregulator ArsR/SmtB family transcription factor [Bacteroidales bacterium]|nr:metalloregulator ArsR/SmtB family transcription factor [Bacteroidales bacterium]HRZ76784.1 metalloregulator ArsR/SmtB family transcription factor [Bacteroidales bacterium]